MSAEHLVCAYVSDSPCGICTMRLDDLLRRLPEDGATKSRDYGRGYAQAVRDVQALIANKSSTPPEAELSTATSTPSPLSERTK